MNRAASFYARKKANGSRFYVQKLQCYKSSQLNVLCKKSLLKNFAVFKEKRLPWSFSSDRVEGCSPLLMLVKFG